VNAILTKPAKSARKAKGDGHLRRAEILSAAEIIFVRDGYQGATIRKIADEVGVSSTALYMHFHDKDEILREICETALEALLVRYGDIVSRPIDAVSRVRLMMAAYMRFGLENPNTNQLAFGSGPGLPSQKGPPSERGQRCRDLFNNAVADIAAEGRLRVGADKTAVLVLWAACSGLVSLRTRHSDPAREDDETLIAAMLDSLFDGLVVG
jgi:AcrR family transcriptional regulator